MEKRELIPADLLIHAIKSGANKVTLAMIHPDDVQRVSMVHLRILLGCEILPQHDVERGYLYVNTKQLR